MISGKGHIAISFVTNWITRNKVNPYHMSGITNITIYLLMSGF